MEHPFVQHMNRHTGKNNTNLNVEFQVLIHGKYMFEDVFCDAWDDSHLLGIVQVSLWRQETGDGKEECEWRVG